MIPTSSSPSLSTLLLPQQQQSSNTMNNNDKDKQDNKQSNNNKFFQTIFSSSPSTPLIITSYMIVSSLLLIINKLAVRALPAPSTVLLTQLVISALSVYILSRVHIINIEPLQQSSIKKFFIVPLSFLGVIFANIKILQVANVDTFIVFRSSTPLVISLLDWWFLGRELPSVRSWGCLLLLLIGSIGFVYTDKFFRIDAYLWVLVWYFVFSFDMVYTKHAVDAVSTAKSMGTWTQVFYTNALASIPLFIILILTGELTTLKDFHWTSTSIFWLSLSCVFGLLMSFLSYLLRVKVSSTQFIVIGNLCKFMSVAVNVAIWDQHASNAGLACLFLCLIGAACYRQAPLRNRSKEAGV
jgi:solute carrier family 35 protein